MLPASIYHCRRSGWGRTAVCAGAANGNTQQQRAATNEARYSLNTDRPLAQKIIYKTRRRRLPLRLGFGKPRRLCVVHVERHAARHRAHRLRGLEYHQHPRRCDLGLTPSFVSTNAGDEAYGRFLLDVKNDALSPGHYLDDKQPGPARQTQSTALHALGRCGTTCTLPRPRPLTQPAHDTTGRRPKYLSPPEPTCQTPPAPHRHHYASAPAALRVCPVQLSRLLCDGTRPVLRYLRRMASQVL